MLFNSFVFLCAFLPATLAAYWALRKAGWHAMSLAALLLASLVFYVYGESAYPWLIVLSIGANFGFGRLISASTGPARRWALAVAVGVNLAALGYFKYGNFFAGGLHAATGIAVLSQPIVLPIGISFFTFTQIAFLVDAYRGEVAEANPLGYALFVTFFPHLIAGPILHHKEMMPQFARRAAAALLDGLASGLPLFAIGLFKKCVVADTIAPFVSALFAQAGGGHPVTLLEGWMAALGYTAQIYFDFSGYSDMAIGIGRMFSIDLPLNFNSPYKAASIVDFWRRWHITLSRFLRDYLYFPLGGNRCGQARRYANLFVTMVLGGMWHGAGWTFLLWGALHGTYLLVCHLWRHAVPGVRLGKAAGGVLTFFCVMLAWVPFRAEDLAATANIWLGMAGVHGLRLPGWSAVEGLIHRTALPVADMVFGRADVLITAAALLACFTLPNSQDLVARFKLGLDTPGYGARRVGAGAAWWSLDFNWRTAVVSGLALGVALQFVGGYSEFIYFHF